MSHRYTHLPRKKQLPGKPPNREDRVLEALKKYFPGITSVSLEEPYQEASAKLHHRLSLLSLVDQAIEHGKQTRNGSSPASTLPGSLGAIPKGGVGTHYIVAGGKYNPQELRKWSNRNREIHAVCAAPKRKNQAEHIVIDVIDVIDVWQDPSPGGLAGADLAAAALASGGTLVLVGTGARVSAARTVATRLGRYAPPLVELP